MKVKVKVKAKASESETVVFIKNRWVRNCCGIGFFSFGFAFPFHSINFSSTLALSVYVINSGVALLRDKRPLCGLTKSAISGGFRGQEVQVYQYKFFIRKLE